MPEWSSPEMARVAETVTEWTGLTFPTGRVRDVEATVQRAMKQRGITRIPAFLDVLRNDVPERDALVAELTIGESYFLRDPAQFELLRRRVVPELIASRTAEERPIRIWSAGCASGEEPYSIAMLFEEANAAERAWIVGTDISRPRLVDAQRGIYSKWALRGSSDTMRERYFRERGRFYELTPRIRSRVDFRYLNLAEDLYPSLSAGVWGNDLILCRNVLIYFDAETVERVARRLIASLSEDGWLILGASDPPIAEMVECDVVLTEAGLVYRRPGAAGDEDVVRGSRSRSGHSPPVGGRTGTPGHLHRHSDARMPDVLAALIAAAEADAAASDAATAAADAADATDATDAAPSSGMADGGIAAGTSGTTAAAHDPEGTESALLEAYARRDFEAVSALAAELSPVQLGMASWLAWLRSLANRGCLEEAGSVAARAMAVHGPTAELLYLHAVLLLEGGRYADAATIVRRALYLDPEMVVAHLALADAERRSGNRPGALRSLRNAAALLATMPEDSPVPASDGDTAGRLAELVKVNLRLLDEAA